MLTEKEKIKIIEKLGIKIHKILSSGEVQCECPLHDDENPSLMINVRTDKFQCFSGCIKGRSFEDLVKKISGKDMDLQDSEKWSEMFKDKLYPEVKLPRIPFIPILPLAINNAGEEYLSSPQRKLNQETIRKFGIMYWKSINAVVVPIGSIGYMVRYIDHKEFKYISGTKINDYLFGVDKIDQKVIVFIILVEGCFDAIYLHQMGFTNTLAIMHGDLSDMQKKILGWYQVPIYIMMDNDAEGQKIANKIVKKLKGEFRVRNCILPEEKDPNECTEEEIKVAIYNAR